MTHPPTQVLEGGRSAIYNLDNVGVVPKIAAASSMQADIMGFSMFYKFSTSGTGKAKHNGGIVTLKYVH
jgi:hypothetical protein